MLFCVFLFTIGDDDVSAYLFFLDDKTGTILKTVEIPTWKQVLLLIVMICAFGVIATIIVGSFEPN